MEYSRVCGYLLLCFLFTVSLVSCRPILLKRIHHQNVNYSCEELNVSKLLCCILFDNFASFWLYNLSIYIGFIV